MTIATEPLANALLWCRARLFGSPTGANNQWIAAQAQRHGATAVTGNLRKFERVPGLGVENGLVG